jgi:DNA-binding GntR family transcriptional regulator
VGDLLHDTISATHAVSTDIAVRVDAHSKVLDGIKRRDPDAAVTAMADHLKQTEILMELAGAQTQRGSREEVKPSRPRYETLADSRRPRSD